MDESSEYVSPSDTVESDDSLRPRWRCLAWWSLLEGAVGAMPVVMADVDREDSFEVPSVHEQEPVETFAADGADPSFDVGVRARCAYRCADGPDPLAAKHLIERRRELAVAIVNQEADRLRSFDERLDDVRACWVAHSPVGLAVIPAKHTLRVPTSMNTRT